jgi:hypothetical protein
VRKAEKAAVTEDMVNSSGNRGGDKSSLKSATMQEIIYFCVPRAARKKRHRTK